MNKQINPFAKKQIDAIEIFCATKQPLVAIKCVTYNHEKYLKDALEGFVKQKTKFPFVAIVHDDASTDKTASILKEYADKYPDIILPIYETENQHSKFDGSLLRITTGALTATGAKYIAICEGDDYWTDPLKLQKQVDFLEDHPDYSMIFTSADVISPTNESSTMFSHLKAQEYSPIEIYRKWSVPTASVVFKKEVYSSELYSKLMSLKNPVMGDIQLFLACGNLGKIYCNNENTCVYRQLLTGATVYNNKHGYQFFKHRISISKIMGKEYIKADAINLSRSYFLWLLKHPFRDFPTNLKYIYELFCFAPWECTKRVTQIPRLIIQNSKKSKK